MPFDSHDTDDQKKKNGVEDMSKPNKSTNINLWMGPCYQFYEFNLVVNSVDMSAMWIRNSATHNAGLCGLRVYLHK